MGLFSDLKGTSLRQFLIGISSGVLLKVSGGTLQIRNGGDTANADLEANTLDLTGDNLTLNSDGSSGADRAYTIQRPTSGMSAAVALTLPPTAGATGQALGLIAPGVLDWLNVNTAQNTAIETVSLVFGTTSPLALVTIPANALVQKVQVVIDTAFNGTPSLSIGVTGTTAKYLGSNQVDLKGLAGDTYESNPNLIPVVTTENLIATYSAGGATAGAARILIHYVVPA